MIYVRLKLLVPEGSACPSHPLPSPLSTGLTGRSPPLDLGLGYTTASEAGLPSDVAVFVCKVTRTYRAIPTRSQDVWTTLGFGSVTPKSLSGWVPPVSDVVSAPPMAKKVPASKGRGSCLSELWVTDAGAC